MQHLNSLRLATRYR